MPIIRPEDSRVERVGLATILTLGVVVLGPPLFVIVPGWLWPNPTVLGLLALQLLYCGLVPFVFWVVLARERSPLRSIGLQRPTAATWLWAGALLAFVSLVLPVVTTPLVNAIGRPGLGAGLDAIAAWPLWLRIFFGVTGGIVEETLYRGYLVERIQTITGRASIAAAVSIAVFTLAHVPMWGVGFAVAADLPFAIVMTLSYLWRRDLIANAVAHSGGLVVSLSTTT